MAFIQILFVISLLFSFNTLSSSRPLIDELEDSVQSSNGVVELPSREDRELVDDATISENRELEHPLTTNESVKHKGVNQHGNGHGHIHGHRHRHRRHHHHSHGHHHHSHGHRHGHQPRKPPRRKAPEPEPEPEPAPTQVIRADIVVAQDGSGNLRTINEAVVAVTRLRNGGERFTMHVKAGIYNEYVDIPYDMENVTMIGDGIGKTIITGNKYYSSNVSTSDTRTFGTYCFLIEFFW